ncbi:DUF4942 domain-containing protein [Atlantibacter sp.]|uniref:DUF4942 domain-containing protein n=1 Tax=Atlantibacter sp. TaxID=1903473 RepID=UPI003917CA78
MLNNRNDISVRQVAIVTGNPRQQDFEDIFFIHSILSEGEWYIFFKRLKLVEGMNNTIAKQYPGMLR